MSQGLLSFLQYYGLEIRWLDILNGLGIRTCDELKSKIEETDLYVELQKEAKEEEKKALKKFTSTGCIQYMNGVRALENQIRDYGLETTYITAFIREGISTLEDLRNVVGNFSKYEKLVQDMNDVETLALQNLMGIDSVIAMEKEVKFILDDIGLDSKYWFPVFSSKLGIDHPLLFECIDSSDYQILNTCARSEEEVVIIDRHFKHERGTFAKRRQNDKEKLHHRYQSIQTLYSELKVLYENKEKGSIIMDERKQRIQNLEIKVREDMVRVLLQISKTESIEHSTSPLATPAERMKEQDDVEDVVIVENASDGLSLRGICLSKETEERVIPREKLLKAPSKFCLSEPTLPHRICSFQFLSLKQEDLFLKMLKTNGFSMTVANSVEENVLKKVANDSLNDQAFTQVRYLGIPLACGTFDTDNLLLSEEAVEELRKIEGSSLTLPENELFKRCEDFFYNFGTHVNVGQMHFGGIYQWKLSYKGKLTDNKKLLENIVDDAMNEFTDARYMHYGKSKLSSEDLSESFKRKYSEFDIDNIKLTVDITGGSLNAPSFSWWKSGIVGCNRSWAVIDRGFNVKGVWELVEYHQHHFHNHSKLSAILCSAWERMTMLKAGQIPNVKQLWEIPQRIQKLCSSVGNCINDPLFSENCETYLKSIKNEKDEITVISRNPHIWQSIVKENSCFATFFEKVAQNKDSYSSADGKIIRFLFQQLVQDLKDSYLNGNDAIAQFASRSSVSSVDQLSNYVSVMYEFCSTVRKYILPKLNVSCEGKYAESTQSVVDGYRIIVTKDFTAYAIGIMNKLHNLGEHHLAYLLAISLTGSGYNAKGKIFDEILCAQDLTALLNEFEEKFKIFMRYKGESVMKIEYYLLREALEMMTGCQDDSSLVKNILHLMHCMKQHFSYQLRQNLEQYLETPDWKDKLRDLAQICLTGTSRNEVYCCNVEKDSETLVQDVTSEITIKSQLHTGTQSEKPMHGMTKEMPIKSQFLTQSEEPIKEVSDDLRIESQLDTRNATPNDIDMSDDCNVLEMLGLSDYYPGKITLQDVMQSSNELKTMADIPWYILHKLLMLDYRGRNVTCLPASFDDKEPKSQSEVEKKGNNEIDDMFDNILNPFKETSDTLMPHPLDVIAAIFVCSSNFLRQILAGKMYMCHVSIPLLLPDVDGDRVTYLLWALRSIICECEFPDNTSVDTHIVSYPMPIVSFIRLGEISRSKSKFVNDIVSSQGHNTFFHRDCASGIRKPKISEGMADVAWFLPSKKESSKINEAVTFINLHGNGTKFNRQCEFLRKISNVFIVMVCMQELQDPDTLSFLRDVVKSNDKMVLILSKATNRTMADCKKSFAGLHSNIGPGLKKQIIIFDFDTKGMKNTREMKDEVVKGIASSLTGAEKLNLEENGKCAAALDISVDERASDVITGQMFARKVFSYIDETNLAGTKAEKLPLQGDLWQKWGLLEKKEHRREGKAKSSEHHLAKLHEEKQTLRHQQLLIYNNPPELLKSYLSYLLQLEGSTRLYFLKWLAIYFDGASRKALPNLIKQYSAKWIEIGQYKSKQTGENDQYMLKLQFELSEIEEKLAMTSLGLEHMMREIGQAYEAVIASPEQKVNGHIDNIRKLPQVMAELMLSGYPLEIMDGDASHVPLSWVMAVLNELKLLVLDKKVFVLSVLGVQSSGKSTLLNTMFGLQFPVSAGRCTRGVYAQIVPVPKDSSDVPYDYILVIDTEGLRAPELGTTKYQHDNELATLVIGLGDMSIINIKGENPTDMQDVMQIVVHALLRMQMVNNNIKLQPSCFFIHQNVGAVNAAEKMIFGQQKLLDNLDKMTVAAADQENVKGVYSFKEVIEFDVENNVWYFSDLWQGDPPMAPTNPGYSEKVLEVKTSLLRDIMQKKKSHSRLSTICIRLKDLWKGILAENFVFSFKNSLELKAYSSLERNLTDLSWSLQNDALKWFNDEHNRIKSSEEELDDLEKSLISEFSLYFTQIFKETNQKLVSFFENSEEKDIIEQWNERSLIKLEHKKEEIMTMIKSAMKNAFEVRRSELLQVTTTQSYKEDIQSRAKKLALELQGKENMSEQELEQQFEMMWTSWMRNLKPPYQQSYDIEAEVRKTLFEKLHADSPLLLKVLRKTSLGYPIHQMLGNFPIVKEHISVKKKLLGFVRAATSEECIEDAYDLIRLHFTEIEDYAKSLEGSNFCPSQATMVIKMTCQMVEEANTSDQKLYKFTTPFKVELVVFVCRYALLIFKEIQQNYLKEIDPRTKLERDYKEQLLNLFKSIYKMSEKEKMVADMLTSCLTESVKKHVMADMPRELANNVRHDVPCLQTKVSLLKNVQIDLLHQKNFDEYLLYLTDLKTCLRKWVRKYTNDYVFRDRKPEISKYAELASAKVHCDIHDIIEGVEAATEHIRSTQDLNHEDNGENRNILQQWLEKFHRGIIKKLPLPKSELSWISEEEIQDVEFFKESIVKNLEAVELKLKQETEAVTKKDLKHQSNSVYDLLENGCLGCCEQCPFCRAPCSLTIVGHDVKHSALQHYPQGVGRFRCSDTKKLVIENCSSLVSGNCSFRNGDTNGVYHPYKNYEKIYPKWKIQGDPSMEASLYWKWVMATFIVELAKEYDAKVPDIPNVWKKITPDEAKASIE